MDHFQQSHKNITDGVKRRFEEIERAYPEAEHQGTIAVLRSQVHKFCNAAVPKNDNELIAMTQGHTTVLMNMNFSESSMRRTKMWSSRV